MKPQDNNLNLDVYFQKALIWYNQKYLLPLTHRSYTICIFLIVAILLSIVFIQTSRLFPIATTMKYAVNFNNPEVNKEISINPANRYHLDPLNSIAKILIENYVTQREKYNYSELKKQIIFVNTNSTRSVFDQYYNFIKIENQLSPVLRYQDQIKVSTKILITLFNSNSPTTVQFRTIAHDQTNNKIIEQMLWQANIDFKIDPVILNQPNGTKFNFLVTGYKVKLIKDETKNVQN
jgi:type IV secretion system protein VirB8